MDLGLLRTFIMAARLQNFHQTAERLFITQPTVTAHVRSLEKQLGFALFERVGKRVRLTPTGERFLPHAQKVIETYEHAVHDVTAWRQGYDMRLQLIVSPVVATSVLPQLLKTFTARHPRVEVMVLTAGSPEISQTILSGKAHLGLSRMISPHPDTTNEVLYDDPVVLVASPAALGPSGELPDWHQLLERHLVLTRNHPVFWDDLLLNLAERQPWLRTLEVDRVDVTKVMVQEGLGVSFLPTSSVTRELQAGTLVSIPVPDMELPVSHTYLVLPVNRTLPGPAQEFVAMLHQAFQ